MPAINHSAKFAERLLSLLAGSSALAALVGARVFGGRAQQKSALPRVIFHEITSAPDTTHDSATSSDPGIEATVMQFDCEARTLSGCRAVVDAISATLQGASPGGGPADFQACFREAGGFAQPLDFLSGDGVTEAHRLSVSFRILWRDA